MVVNWNLVNNTLSEAVLAADLLGDLLAELGCRVRGVPGGRQFRGRCPVHGGDGDSFQVGTDGRLPIYWACFSQGCHKKKPLMGNLLGLVRGALTGDPDRPATLGEARRVVEDFLRRAGASTTPRSRAAPDPRPEARKWTREQVRSRLTIPSPYFVSRGLCPAVLDEFDIGDSVRLGRAVVPVYDDAGETCVGYTSRAVEPPCPECGDGHPADTLCFLAEPRWKNSDGFARADYLFGYAQARKAERPSVLVVEGAPEVLRAAEAGLPAVAVLGTDVSPTQARKLAALSRAVVVAFDRDEAGRAKAPVAAAVLRRAGVAVEVRHPPEGYKDLGEMAAADVRAWAADVAPNPVARTTCYDEGARLAV